MMNYEFEDDVKGEKIINMTIAQRLKWLGHIWGSDKNKNSKIKDIIDWEPGRGKGRGRDRSKWMDQVLRDLKELKIKNWREILNNR